LSIRNFTNVGPSKFQFQACPKLKDLGVDVTIDDILQNNIKETLTMDSNSRPWRGAKEKDACFLQMLIQASSLPSDIVTDCTAIVVKF